MINIETQLITHLEKIISQYGIGKDIKIEIEAPRSLKYGDLSTNIAMKLSGILKKCPQEIAEGIVGKLNLEFKDIFEKIEILPPGFINFHFSWNFLRDFLRNVIEKERDIFRNDLGAKKKVLLEFVSANPTGPLSIAHGRQAAIGASLARILKFSGYSVDKEYYINDEGNQIDLLATSLKVRCLQLLGQEIEIPSGGYEGEYLIELAKKLIKDKNLNFKKVEEANSDFFLDYVLKEIISSIKEELNKFGVIYEYWSSQRKLRLGGKIDEVVEQLKSRGLIYKKDDALWFKAKEYGDDQDRVIRKADGQYTYFAADIAYHREKFERGYDLLIDIWGPDHHGYIPRINAAVKALGYKQDKLKILIVQLATLYRNGKPFRLSTRKGQLITLKEVVNEIGKDATLYFLLTRKLDSHLDFDIELAKKQSLENPVYYIQYAYARISSILNYASENKIKFNKKVLSHIGEFLKEEEEKLLLRALAQFSRIIKISVFTLEPSLITTYLYDLASKFHSYYNKHRVVTQDSSLSNARISLCLGVQIALKTGLSLLGISAPEKM